MNIRELLGENYEAIIQKLDGKELIINDGSYIPRARLNEEIEKKKAYESKIATYESQIEETKTMLKDNEGLKNKYSELNTKYLNDLEAKDKEISNIKKVSLAEAALTAAGAKHVDLLLNKINTDSLTLDNNNLIGINDVIGNLKTTYEDLFVTEGAKSKGVAGDRTPNTNSSWETLAQSLI